MNDKVKQTLQTILDQFKTGDIPKAVANAMFPIPDIPCSKWSLLNRTLVFLSGTMDARGYRQWQQVNRYVKKASKAIFILVPFIKKRNDYGQERRRYTVLAVSRFFVQRIRMASLWIMSRLSCRICL
jgi:hypothetical protein